MSPRCDPQPPGKVVNVIEYFTKCDGTRDIEKALSNPSSEPKTPSGEPVHVPGASHNDPPQTVSLSDDKPDEYIRNREGRETCLDPVSAKFERRFPRIHCGLEYTYHDTGRVSYRMKVTRMRGSLNQQEFLALQKSDLWGDVSSASYKGMEISHGLLALMHTGELKLETKIDIEWAVRWSGWLSDGLREVYEDFCGDLEYLCFEDDNATRMEDVSDGT